MNASAPADTSLVVNSQIPKKPRIELLPQVNLQVLQIDRSQEAVLRTLLGYYCHDLAECFQLDANEDGTYLYPIDELWDAGNAVHIAYLDRIPVGFAIVGSAACYGELQGVKDMREFFMVRRYRRTGLGSLLAMAVWEKCPGPWLVRVFRGNAPGLRFWDRIIDTYTEGSFKYEIRRIGDREWSYFSFGTAALPR
jgi:predicted acetyltransferase